MASGKVVPIIIAIKPVNSDVVHGSIWLLDHFTGAIVQVNHHTSTVRRGDERIGGAAARGAEIVSGGSIIVIGALLGTAIAGTNANREAFVFAAQMKPEKISISRFTYEPPKTTGKEQKKEEKLLKKQNLINCSMIAEIVDEKVLLRPVLTDTFGADEDLYELID